MTENNPVVVAAQTRPQPALRKLARAYIALARQFRGSAAATVSVSAEAPRPKESA
jgi:hypothetical protein